MQTKLIPLFKMTAAAASAVAMLDAPAQSESQSRKINIDTRHGTALKLWEIIYASAGIKGRRH